MSQTLLSSALFATAWLSLLGAEAGSCLVFSSGQSSAQSRPPPEGLGWSGACRRGGLSAVHLGEGWILTAAHVGVGSVQLGDEDFTPVLGSEVVFGQDDGSDADLLMFRVRDMPFGERLSISRQPPELGERVVLIGNGGVGAEPLSWLGRKGFRVGSSRGLLWGENLVALTEHDLELGVHKTRSFAFELDDFFALPAEAIAVAGDSGGPVFRRGARGWELLGILVASSQAGDQPADTAFYGGLSFAADLSRYREEIEAVRGVAGPRGCGLGFGQTAWGCVAVPLFRARRRLARIVSRPGA